MTRDIFTGPVSHIFNKHVTVYARCLPHAHFQDLPSHCDSHSLLLESVECSGFMHGHTQPSVVGLSGPMFIVLHISSDYVLKYHIQLFSSISLNLVMWMLSYVV